MGQGAGRIVECFHADGQEWLMSGPVTCLIEHANANLVL